jgi:hypothetical protein
MEAKADRRKLVKPTQVLHDRDASRQQRRMRRPRRVAGLVDVDRVDADQSGLLLDSQSAAPAVRKRLPVSSVPQ